MTGPQQWDDLIGTITNANRGAALTGCVDSAKPFTSHQEGC